jgi:hypothetical protein
MRAHELQDPHPFPIALTPEQVQAMTISKETAIWISAYSKVQELFEYIPPMWLPIRREEQR